MISADWTVPDHMPGTATDADLVDVLERLDAGALAAAAVDADEVVDGELLVVVEPVVELRPRHAVRCCGKLVEIAVGVVRRVDLHRNKLRPRVDRSHEIVWRAVIVQTKAGERFTRLHHTAGRIARAHFCLDDTKRLAFVVVLRE